MKPTTDRRTVGDFLLTWVDGRRVSVRDATWRRYRSLITAHVIPTIGSIPLAKLTAADVDALTAGIQERRSPQTAAHARRVLIGAMNRAVRDRAVRYNVAAESDPVRVDRPKIDGTTPVQARAILDAFRDHRLEMLVVLALDSGARLGELLGLRWRDIDFDERTIRIERTWQRDRFEPPKTARSRRAIDLSSRTIALLRQQPTPIDREGLVFSQPEGRPLDGTKTTREFQAVLKLNGLPRLRFHDLRHACATLLLAAGVPVHVVSERLGHRDERITLTVYSHVIPKQRRDAADRLDALIYGSVAV
jgi:integrase